MERLVIFPDVLESEFECQLVNSLTFTKYLSTFLPYGDGNLINLIGFMDRPIAELRPNPRTVRVRQAVINTMVIELPSELYTQISKRQLSGDEEIRQVLRHAVLLATMKLPQSGEQRLVGKLASGLGGHVDEADYHPKMLVIDDLLKQAALRELCDEELQSENDAEFRALVAQKLTPYALLNSSYGEVESVHLGFVTILAVPSDLEVGVREVDKLETIWVPVNSFIDQLDRFAKREEGHYVLDRWTQLLFNQDSKNLAQKIIQSITR